MSFETIGFGGYWDTVPNFQTDPRKFPLVQFIRGDEDKITQQKGFGLAPKLDEKAKSHMLKS